LNPYLKYAIIKKIKYILPHLFRGEVEARYLLVLYGAWEARKYRKGVAAEVQ